jgi:hypothetical protein
LEAKEISDFQINEKNGYLGKISMDHFSQNIQNMRKIFWVPIFIIEIRKIMENGKILKTQQLGLSDS